MKIDEQTRAVLEAIRDRLKTGEPGAALAGAQDLDRLLQASSKPGADGSNPLGTLIADMASRFDQELLALSPGDILSEWHWRWDERQSAEWNTYQFADILALHRRRWRRWEEHHHGSCCVVERVRDKYIMPRVSEFLAALSSHHEPGQGGPGGWRDLVESVQGTLERAIAPADESAETAVLAAYEQIEQALISEHRTSQAPDNEGSRV